MKSILYFHTWGLNPLKFNLEGSKGWPLKGDPSASQAFFRS
jgi:hypothetical protein